MDVAKEKGVLTILYNNHGEILRFLDKSLDIIENEYILYAFNVKEHQKYHQTQIADDWSVPGLVHIWGRCLPPSALGTETVNRYSCRGCRCDDCKSH